MSDPVNAHSDADAMRLRGMEDARWVQAVRSGDESAFDQLVERYHRRAVSVAYRLLGNSEDAGDAAQDAFLRAYRNLSKLEDPTRFGPWLLRIVTNLSLNMRRSRGRAPSMSTDDLVEGMGEIRTASGAPMGTSEAGPETAELASAVRTAIDALPEKQRLALTLFSIEGLPQKEVAEIMNCTVQLVKWNVFQARKSLKEALADFME